jgi:hypothetical protein
MGRGRAKAKQTKVARELKYNSPNTDLSALQAELAGSTPVVPNPADDEFEGEEFADDPYAKYYEEDAEEYEGEEEPEEQEEDN